MARRRRPTHPLARTALRGLTLIELLVALALMAVLTTLSWRVLDGMTRTQQQTQEHADSSQQWQVALAQWQTDLDALQESGVQPALDFNGRVLRLTRRAPASATEADNGLHVVAWALQPDAEAGNGLRWARWMSPPLRQRQELERAWQQAAQWADSPGSSNAAQERQWLLTPVTAWQLFYHRGGSWSNPQSSADAGTSATTPGEATDTPRTVATPPDGIRLQLTLPDTTSPSGTLTVDWVRPQTGGGKAQ